MADPLLEALTAVELREAELLAWGAVGAEWTLDEIRVVLSGFGSPDEILDRLLDGALVVKTPTGGYRSRTAETVRLLANLRQSFPSRRVTDGRRLVLDYRFLHRPRRRPRREIPAEGVFSMIRASVGTAGEAAAKCFVPDLLSGFQVRSTRVVLGALTARRRADIGVMVAAGTGSGKTLAFYLPLLSWLSAQTARSGRSGTLALALYPRNELIKDQLRALLENLARLTPDPGGRVPSVATWFGPTPYSASAVRNGQADGWTLRREGYLCPFLRCLRCNKELVWPKADVDANRERLVCTDRSCGAEISGAALRLTRQSARRSPADLMLSTTESLNRQLSAPGNLVAFGVRPATLSAVLLDEAHIYEGTSGAQNALLLRRLRHAVGRPLVWAGLSATLQNAADFFARLVNVRNDNVTVVRPEADELEESGAEYLIALRHDPYSETGILSASIQTSMLLARSLDSMVDNPFDPPPNSEGAFGSRLFVFTDKLDSTNRLYWDLLDAEGWAWPGEPKSGPVLTLAHLRSGSQDRMEVGRREPPDDRDADGQWWWLAEYLGHGADSDRQMQVARTSSQDHGVSSDAQIIVATATLEVGFDDNRVGAVLQHKAPRAAAPFLQRKGRAGRRPSMRPWTAVVLSDWGRDRQAWEAYDALFDPNLPPRDLPIENHYVLRIQAVYSLLDWLAGQGGYTKSGSTWADLSGPAELFYPDDKERRAATAERQSAIAATLQKLLRPGPERQQLRRHLRDALALGTDERAESVVDSLLWDAPRAVLLAVVPTMRRLLEEQWAGVDIAELEVALRTRTPLRQFVPGNLFDDLMVPDVAVQVPGRSGAIEVEHLPAARTLTEFCPGNVTRHFGVWAGSKRHWLPVPALLPGQLEAQADVSAMYRTIYVDTLSGAAVGLPLYTPTAITLERVPEDVRDSSSVRPEWEFAADTFGAGSPLPLARGVERLLGSLVAHLHASGGGARVIRFARAASGTRSTRQRSGEPVRVRYGIGAGSDWRPVALGMDLQCDSLVGTVRLPAQIGTPGAAERTQRLRHLTQVEANFPDDLTHFDRVSLTETLLLALVDARSEVRKPMSDAAFSAALAQGAEALGLPGDWTDCLYEPEVRSTLRTIIDEVTATERSPAWTAWWQRRFTLSAAHLTLAALAMLCPGIDPSELAIDLDPLKDGQFWITEQTPGGTGQIETFTRVVVQDAAAVSRAVEEAMAPSAVETMDDELCSLLRSGRQELHDALADLRSSWRQGHSAVSEAIESLDRRVEEAGLTLNGPARSALSTRLLGPGAHPRLLTEVLRWLQQRDEIAERVGLEVEPRTLGGLLADDIQNDDVLHLRSNPTRAQRARAVSNVLWPWGQANRASASYNPYAPGLEPVLTTVREHLDLRPTAVNVAEWDAETRRTVDQLLVSEGEVVLVSEVVDRSRLRAALLDLQTRPVEFGTLLCHPIVVGVRRSVHCAEVRVALREAW